MANKEKTPKMIIGKYLIKDNLPINTISFQRPVYLEPNIFEKNPFLDFLPFDPPIFFPFFFFFLTSAFKA